MIIALLGGGDWADASICHLVVPGGMDLDKEKKAWWKWYNDEYRPKYNTLKGIEYVSFSRIEYISFEQQLINNGARLTTEDEVLEYWNE